MRNLAKIGKKLSFWLPVVLLTVMVSAPDVWAAEGAYSKCSGAGSIFAIMRCMVAKTLFDLRMIIYVVGAIGLITFTFAAIFGKISFKHLANICFSLFLVSMMSPFVKFFSGSETALAELTYENYLSPVDGVADDNTVNGSCGSNCPSSSNSGGLGNGAGGSTTSLGAGETEIDGGMIDEVVVVGQRSNNNPLAGLGSLTTPPTLPDNITITGLPTLTGDGTAADTRTGWQKFKDTIKTVASEGQKAFNTASTIYSAAKNVKNAVDNTTNAWKNGKGIGGILAAGATTASSIQGIAGNVQHAAGTFGENYTDKEGNPTLNDKVGAALGQIVDGAKEGEDAFRTGTDINNTAEAMGRMGSDIFHGKGLK